MGADEPERRIDYRVKAQIRGQMLVQISAANKHATLGECAVSKPSNWMV